MKTYEYFLGLFIMLLMLISFGTFLIYICDYFTYLSQEDKEYIEIQKLINGFGE